MFIPRVMCAGSYKIMICKFLLLNTSYGIKVAIELILNANGIVMSTIVGE